MGQTMRSPIPWIGGKHYSASIIVNTFPSPQSYDVYVDLFGGAAHILLAKPPYKHIEVYNDINEDLVNFWMHCRDHATELEERCRSLPYSRAMYYQYHKSLFDGTELEPLERAARWFYVLRSSFTGWERASSPSGWSASPKDAHHGPAHAYQSAFDLFASIRQRFQRAVIDNRDFSHVFQQWDNLRTLFYVDPPYNDAEHYYQQSFTLEDHERLAALLNSAKGSIALSYYPHPMVDTLYSTEKWRRITWKTFKHAQRTKTTHDGATEMLLCNYPEPTQSLWSEAI